MSNPWQPYQCGQTKPTDRWTEKDCQQLLTVSHVAHLETARRIVNDRTIRAGLVFDASKLNKSRILVSWLSPNDWNQGSRYGNISFDLEFSPLVENKNYYWVEEMTQYNPTALRILITEKKYKSKLLIPYDPTSGDGPWIYDPLTDSHYWNGYYTLEFMYEGDISIRNINNISACKHHEHMCCIDPSACSDKGILENKAAGFFLSWLLVAEKSLPDPNILSLPLAHSEYLMQFFPDTRVKFKGLYTNALEEEHWLDLILYNLAARKISEAREAASMLKSSDRLAELFETRISNTLEDY